MTSYSGGKQRIGKKIANCIQDFVKDEKIIGYCEPFCGMLSIYHHMVNKDIDYLAGDLSENIVLFWKAVQNGWEPPTKVSEEEYNFYKKSKNSAMKCFVGHQYGFSGSFFGGYAPKYGKTIDSNSACNRIQKIKDKINNVKFTCDSYDSFSGLEGYIIYCDPPYNNTKCWYGKTFDNDKFWQWCRNMSMKNFVFISEYNAPNDFTSIWQKTNKLTGLSGKNNIKTSRVRTEQIFVFNKIFH